MKKKIFCTLLLSSLQFTSVVAQERGLFLEGKMGLNGVIEPSIHQFKAKNFALGYKFSNEFSLKAEYSDFSFRSTQNNVESGIDQKTVALQGIIDLTNLADSRRARYSIFNVELHAGVGLTNITTTLQQGNDKALSLIGGITPKLKIVDNLDLLVDATVMMNESQHFNFDGKNASTGNVNNSFTGILYNLGAGLRYTFGNY
ncbi:hypothetical protein [Flavobacterium sp.]|uniref:hypothetical protein n=1 Tax=Flavobacterium sp. TaxID=239 RepID=UPI003D0EA65A